MSDFFIGTLYESKPGTSTNNHATEMLSVPMPQQGMSAGSAGFSQVIEYEYGGADVFSSPQSHRRYEFSWTGARASEATRIDQIKRLSAGEFGNGLIYFADPYNYTTNLMPPAWASPSLIRSGWRTIYDTDPLSYSSASAANSTNRPRLSPVFDITNDAGDPPVDGRSFCVLPIPPDKILHVGFTGASTGSAVVRARPILLDGSYSSPVDLTLISWSSATQMNETFSGSTYKAVEIYFTRTSSTPSTLTITSSMAQLLDTASPPPANRFTAGQGNTGCRFESPALEETYTYVDMGRSYRIKGLSATLIEVGTSARYS